MSIFYRRLIQNFAIFLLMFIGIKNFIISLPLRYSPYFHHLYSRIDTRDTMFIQGRLAFVVSLVMLLFAYNLYKRIRSAWIGEIIVLIVSIVLQAVYFHMYALHMIIIESVVLLILILSADDFSRMPNRATVERSVAYIAASFLLLAINTTIAISLIHGNLHHMDTFSTAFIKSLKLLIFMDKSVLTSSGTIMNIYADSLIFLYWLSLIIALITILKPITYDFFKNKSEKEKVHPLVLEYGQNPMSYLAMEDDKFYFFSTQIDGVCAYTIVGNVMVICGDMICHPHNANVFLNELITFTKIHHYDLIFLNITDAFLDLFKIDQFGIMKYGEDACFKLEDYNLQGGAIAKVRAAINHANKANIKVCEYKPQLGIDSKIEKSIHDISHEWLKNKNMPEMKFMLGGLGLEAPYARRYFYAEDESGHMLGFIVFLPYMNGKAYLADVTRRAKQAPQGVLEKITYDAFMVMKEEGVLYGNLGLSPLYNVGASETQSIGEKVSAYIYENLNEAYDFKSLHRAKEKFAPTHWEPRYIAYYPKPMTIKYAYAIIRSQNPVKISKIVSAHLNKKKEA